MYSPAFIDEVYKKAQEDATKLVRDYQADLERAFDVQPRPGGPDNASPHVEQDALRDGRGSWGDAR